VEAQEVRGVFFFVFVIVLLFVSPAFADFSGRVVGVSDDDTIKVLHNGQAEKIRLHGIDCQEKAQPFGTKAKQFTSEMVFGTTPMGRSGSRTTHLNI
jgi:endonuclease YncB( thermonuclease family)